VEKRFRAYLWENWRAPIFSWSFATSSRNSTERGESFARARNSTAGDRGYVREFRRAAGAAAARRSPALDCIDEIKRHFAEAAQAFDGPIVRRIPGHDELVDIPFRRVRSTRIRLLPFRSRVRDGNNFRHARSSFDP
jgi:hypothetical protein